MKRAIVYHAYCRQTFVEAAMVSAESAKQQMPNVDTVLLTDLPARRSKFDQVIGVDPVDLVAAHLPPLLKLPKRYTAGIYLDADTYVCAPLHDVFDLLDSGRIDVALVHTSGKERDTFYPPEGVPEAYPYWRSTFIAFRHDDSVRRQLFVGWRDAFYDHLGKYRGLRRQAGPCHGDQAPLRIALYRSDLRIATLPPNYCTTLGDIVIRNTVRVAHCKENMKKLSKEANRHAPGPRLFIKGKSKRLD